MPDNLVLCYHALSPAWEADLSTTPERFEGQVSGLLRRGYRGARFSEVVNADPRAGLMAITFDDAFRSVFELALPVLTRLGLPATLFVPTDFIGTGAPLRWPGIDEWFNGPSEHELTPMSWPEIQSLADAGWEIGSHSGSHPHLTQLGDATLEEELTRSKRVCEAHISAACLSVAYPYGDVDDRVRAAAAQAGYTAGAALPSRLDSRDPLNWPRIGVYRLDDAHRFRLKVSQPLRRLRASTLWNLVVAAS